MPPKRSNRKGRKETNITTQVLSSSQKQHSIPNIPPEVSPVVNEVKNGNPKSLPIEINVQVGNNNAIKVAEEAPKKTNVWDQRLQLRETEIDAQTYIQNGVIKSRFGIRGIFNTRNECYAIACLQALLSCPPIIDRLNSDYVPSSEAGRNLKKILKKAALEYSCSRKAQRVDITGIIEALGFPAFEQNDPSEMLEKLSDVIGNLSKVGTMTYLKCANCGYHREIGSTSEKIFLAPIGSNHTEIKMEDLISHHFGEVTSGVICSNPDCRKLKTKMQEKTVLLHSLPQIVVFAFNLFTTKMQRFDGTVEIPPFLDLTDYAEKDELRLPFYELQSVVYHRGPYLQDGHYVAKVKRGDHFYVMNDTQHSTDLSEVDAPFTPYLAFFKKL